jgi:signal transduction histidine kinase
MGEQPARKIERIRINLSLVKPIVTLSVGVLVPVILSTATGIVAIVIGESSVTLILGILVVSFMAAAIGGSIIVYVLLGRRARLARLQSDLLANVTHDLRTPLAAIRMHAQTLQSGLLADDPAAARGCVGTIVRETEWLEAMIDRILSWRAASKDRDLPRTSVADIGSTLDEAADRFGRMIPPDEIEFSRRIDAPGPVRHDPQAIQQALLNLLVNAYKYTRPPRRIALAAHREGKLVRISVEDNGVGIPAAELGRIFEPFHRVNAADTRISGAGLGLAVVEHAVRAHGGEIRVESTPGKGSRFTISLPAEPAGEPRTP